MKEIFTYVLDRMHQEEDFSDKQIIGTTSIVEDVDDIESKNFQKPVSSEMKSSKWKIVKESTNRISPGISKGDIKLANLISELQKFSIEEEENKKADNLSIQNPNNWIKISKKFLSNLLSNSKFHYCIIILVILDLMVVLVDLVLGLFFLKFILYNINLFYLSPIIHSLFNCR
jgi:hypothetical protein